MYRQLFRLTSLHDVDEHPLNAAFVKILVLPE
jgi:hypothetical protein